MTPRMDWSHITVFGGLGLGITAALWLAIIILLPKGERRRAKTPFIMMALSVATMIVRAFITEGTQPDDVLRVVGVFFLTLSAARSLHLLLLNSVLTRIISGEIPRILQDLIQAIFLIGALLITLRSAGVEPGALFTTSALLTAVVGFALQDTLGNLFAGLAIQAQQPFRVGEWIQWDDAEDRIGRVVEMNWRAVKVVTLEHVEMTVPNATLAKSALRNFSAPTKEARRKVFAYAPYDVSPHRVREALLRCVTDVAGVITSPRPTVIAREFSERGVQYEVRYFIREFERRDLIAGEIQERLWYALSRIGVEIPVPQRTVRMHEVTAQTIEHDAEVRVERREEALRHVDFLDALPTEALHQLAELVDHRLYATSEQIIRQGDHGEELFVVLRGQVRVEIGNDRRKREVSRLGPGQFFGEMSLMTGEARKASVSAVDEVELMVISKQAFQPVLEAAPELAETVSEVLARRAEELTHVDPKQTLPGSTSAPETGVLLDRIKKFFSLGNDETP